MDNNTFYILGQILGGAAVVVGFLAFQQKTQLKIIIFQFVTAITFTLHYLLIGAPTAVALNTLCALNSVCFGFRNKRNSKGKTETIICSLAIVAASIYAWESIYSVFIMIGLLVETISLSFYDPQKTRMAVLVKSPLCLIYNGAVLSIGGIVFECAVLTSAIIGLIKNRKQ